jgi:hypothetical protein
MDEFCRSCSKDVDFNSANVLDQLGNFYGTEFWQLLSNLPYMQLWRSVASVLRQKVNEEIWFMQNSKRYK